MVKRLWQWVRDPGVWRYAAFGILTTVLNYAVYLLLFWAFGWPAALCNGTAWVVAVLFAFVTNKQFVFQDADWSWQAVRKELITFLACRIGSGVIETVILLVFVDIFEMDALLWKLLSGTAVIILNYLGSKWLVFSKTE